MSEQRNKEVVRAYFARVWRDGDFEFARSIIDPDYRLHVPAGVPNGFEGWRAGVEHFRSVFQGICFDNLHIIAEGDLVAVRSVIRGVHTGGFMGIEPTGATIAVECADYYRLRDGVLVEHWDVVDFFGLLHQIGGVPAALRLPGVPA